MRRFLKQWIARWRAWQADRDLRRFERRYQFVGFAWGEAVSYAYLYELSSLEAQTKGLLELELEYMRRGYCPVPRAFWVDCAWCQAEEREVTDHLRKPFDPSMDLTEFTAQPPAVVVAEMREQFATWWREGGSGVFIWPPAEE